MKCLRKILYACILLDLLIGYAGFIPLSTTAAAQGGTQYIQSYGPVSSTAGCTAATGVATSAVNTPCGGQGPMFQNTNVTLHTLSWIVVAGGGSVSSCTVQLETSAAGGTFVAMTSAVAQTCTSSGSYTFLASAGANFTKFNVTALTTTAAASVTFTYTGTATPAVPSPAIGYAINCGTTTTCTPVNVQNLRVIYGSCTASAATTCTVTAIAPAFSGTTSYFCAASDATTQANGAFKITYASATSFVITTTSSSDTFNYICWGT